MSNKTLVILIIVILVVFAGVVWAFHRQNQSVIYPSQTTNDQSIPLATSTPVPTPTPTPSSVSATPLAEAGCTPDFSQTELNSNANINIQNREVQISVKNFGNIDVEFYPNDAPKAVTNFLRLTDAGYYNCVTFHRVAKGFVIQGGDPTGTGSGGQSAFGAPFADELNPNTASYKAGYVTGVLAMANSGPNTNGSQFFIMLADQPSMPHLYTIFGKVVAGQNVVDAIGQVPITPNLQMDPTGNDGAPVTPVVMTSVKIIK